MKTLDKYRNVNVGAITSGQVEQMAKVISFFKENDWSISNVALTGEFGEYAVRYFRYVDGKAVALEDALVKVSYDVEVKTVVVIADLRQAA